MWDKLAITVLIYRQEEYHTPEHHFNSTHFLFTDCIKHVWVRCFYDFHSCLWRYASQSCLPALSIICQKAQHSAMVVGIMWLSSLRILRAHSFLPIMQDSDTQSCAKHSHLPGKTMAVQLIFCLVWTAGAGVHKVCMFKLHMPNRGTGGCIWTTHRTCFQ